MKKVSVIIPCYNQGLYAAFALESVLAQTYKNIEIICVNDCSTDNSDEVIQSYCEKYDNIIYINLPENKGVINAKNQAIARASGEYILPLDADDLIMPEYVEKAVEVFELHPETAIVYCKAKFLKEQKNSEAIEEDWALKPLTPEELLFGNYIFNSAVFKKSDFVKIGGYKDYMKEGLEDWELWISFLELYSFNEFKVVQLDETLFTYRIHGSYSRNKQSQKFTRILQENIIKNHLKLYFKSEIFFSRLFNPPNFDYFEKQIKKYKKRAKNMLILNLSLIFVFILSLSCILVFK